MQNIKIKENRKIRKHCKLVKGMSWSGIELVTLPSNSENPCLDQLSQRASLFGNWSEYKKNRCHSLTSPISRQTSSSSIQILGILRRPQSDAMTPANSKIQYKQYKFNLKAWFDWIRRSKHDGGILFVQFILFREIPIRSMEP